VSIRSFRFLTLSPFGTVRSHLSFRSRPSRPAFVAVVSVLLESEHSTPKKFVGELDV
jgi:hypothetical protein